VDTIPGQAEAAIKGVETMICENSEMTGRDGKPPPSGPKPEPDLKMDLDRLVWDPEYREQMRRRLKRPS
jgi:hypothetical protein